jgi:hypothetical protein
MIRAGHIGIALLLLAMTGLYTPAHAEVTAETRVAERSFPSVFAAWTSAERLNKDRNGNRPSLSTLEGSPATIARHDLFFGGWAKFGLRLAHPQNFPGLETEFTPTSVEAALRSRATLLAANPNLIILAEVRYYSASPNFLPPDSPWWQRAPDGTLLSDDPKVHSYRLDISNPDLQRMAARICAALVNTRVFDGCMLDWWHDNDHPDDRLALIRQIRAAVGDSAMLIANVNRTRPTHTAEFLNGIYLEGFGSSHFQDWRTAASNLLWAGRHLHRPAVTLLEGWWRASRDDYSLMRAVTTLSLVFSDGYVLFSDPNSLPTRDHLHDWYPFWDKSLGRPTSAVANPDRPDLETAYSRRFEKGLAVFNPPDGRLATINFPRPKHSVATGATSQTFKVAPGDGDLFLE